MTEQVNLATLQANVTITGDRIKALKAIKAPKSEVEVLVAELQAAKTALATALLAEQAATGLAVTPFDRNALEQLLLKRFFYAPSFQIYGGVAGLFDYGPPGCALQNNILSVWRQHFVLEEDMLELECTNMTPESVLKTSGHVDRFADYMVKDKVTGDIFRADHLVKQVLKKRLDDDLALKTSVLSVSSKADKKKAPAPTPLSPEMVTEYNTILETLDNYQGMELYDLITKYNIRAPETGNEVSEPVLFNLMFETQIGPTGQFKGFLRPETAQGHFLNFKRLLDFNTEAMPFASASIGKSFRNEISPRQGLLRVREFTMAEIEHFVHPDQKNHGRFAEVAHIEMPLYSAADQLLAKGPSLLTIGEAVRSGLVNNETLGYFLARIYLFLVKIGINANRIRFRQHMANEMAHYACDCWDAEIESSYGWIESVGCADRSAYDLTAHSNKTKEKLVARQVLDPPLIREGLVLDIQRSKLGPAFKANAKAVQGALEALLDPVSGVWDQKALKDMEERLKAQGSMKVMGSDGNEYEITSAMVSIAHKKEKISVLEYTPNVIEPSFGIGRILYALLEHNWYTRPDDAQRHVFSFPPVVAPTKVLVVPISNGPEFRTLQNEVVGALRYASIANKVDSSSGSIGRRYARNDELGTPFAITLDFQSLQDGTLTLRERDTTRQIRAEKGVIVGLVEALVAGRMSWAQVTERHPMLPIGGADSED